MHKFNEHSFEMYQSKMEQLLVNKYLWITMDIFASLKGIFLEGWTKLERRDNITIKLCLLDVDECSQVQPSLLIYLSKRIYNYCFLAKIYNYFQNKKICQETIKCQTNDNGYTNDERVRPSIYEGCILCLFRCTTTFKWTNIKLK